MYIIDGIAYAGEQEQPITVKSVRTLEDYKLWIRFANGQMKIFDFAPLLDEPCYRCLKDKAVFDRAYVDYGVVVWNDGDVDIAPEFLHERGVVCEA